MTPLPGSRLELAGPPVPLDQIRMKLGDAVKDAASGSVTVISYRGIPAAAIVPYEAARKLLEQQDRDEAADAAMKDWQEAASRNQQRS